MGLIHFILNIAALLLWINWRAMKFPPFAPQSGLSLVGTLKRTTPSEAKRWIGFAYLAGLLVVRSIFYWQIGSGLNWAPRLHLGAISLPFRSDYPSRMALYSVATFFILLGGFYSCLFLLSVANRKVPDTDYPQRIIRWHLGWLERLPWAVKLILPMIVGTLAWVAVNPYLRRMGLVPAPRSQTHLWEQALVLGLGSYLSWKWVIVAVLGLNLLNSYIYLGRSPWWNFLAVTAANLARPIRWLPLQLGKVDLRPVLLIVLVIFGSEWLKRGLTEVYWRLPI